MKASQINAEVGGAPRHLGVLERICAGRLALRFALRSQNQSITIYRSPLSPDSLCDCAHHSS